MRFLFGLGNPGPKYVDTRHNFGFLLLERVSDALRQVGWKQQNKRQTDGLAYWEDWLGPQEQKAVLVWPLTYMNLSGKAVEFFLAPQGPDFDASDLLVVIDELSLPLGRIRLRKKGSSGGHNGLKSVQAALGHTEYPRLKLGIGQPTDGDVVDYVLGAFEDDQRPLVKEVLEVATQTAIGWLSGEQLNSLSSTANGWRSPSLEPKDPPKAHLPTGDQIEESTV